MNDEKLLKSLVQNGECELKVSSVLNKSSKEYGKQFLFDGSPETCWCTDQGSPQWVAIKWPTLVTVCKIEASFQGGFCGSRETVIEKWCDESQNWEQIDTWHLEDVGTVQSLTFPEPVSCTRLRIFFPNSTDFFGRIIMYSLNIFTVS